MLLKSIEYKDFRPFKGTQKIEFTSPTNADENVYIILGDNTFGKSTIILSFIWCFYGVSNFNHKKEILNRDVENSMKLGERAKASVTVVFEDENREYTITRSQTFVKNYYGLKEEPTTLSMKYIDENGQSKACGQLMSEHEKAIRAMLPYDLSSFFFFEGEKDNSISKKDLSLAVKSLLGLEAMAKMKEHMHGNTKSIATNSVLGHYQGKLLKTSKSIQVDSWIKNKETYEQELENLAEELDSYSSEITQYESRINQTRETLIKAEPTKEIQGKINGLLKAIAQDEEQLKKQRASFLDYFNKYAIDLLAYPLYKRSTKKLSEMHLDDKGIIGIEVTAIKELLERGTCLCGTDLNKGSAAYKSVESYIDILPPKSVSTLVREMKEKISLMEDGASEFLNEFEDKYKEIQYTLNRISRNQREIEAYEEKLEALDKINSTQYEADLRTFIGNKTSLEEKKKDATKRQGVLEDKIAECTKNLESAERNAEKNEKAKLAYDYASLIYKWINDTYERKEGEMRIRLQNLVTEKFNNMYSGKRDVRINENYQIEILVNGKTLDDTGGLRVIQYFAYVAGLVHLASQVMAERKEDEKLGEEYPLVLDAAFSHADEGHVKSISKELASSTKQLVLAVMPKDWNYASETISEKVARVYRLNKISETYVRIEEVV